MSKSEECYDSNDSKSDGYDSPDSSPNIHDYNDKLLGDIIHVFEKMK